ncbi:MAG: thioredoxin-dependent thiol peroxidase [Pseudomonadota bacterium]
MAKELREGLKAPAFKMATDGGGTAQLKDFAGKALVLYFYPKDDTPGCTKEAIGFSERYAEFQDAGAEILGVSADPVAKHDKFKAKHDLSIPLASDEDHATLEKFGVWVEKSMYGKKYMGIERATFLIDADGKIARIWRKVKVPGHVDEVFGAVEAL